MKTLKTLSTLAATAILVPSVAFASVSVGDLVGGTEMDIRTNLEAAGYVVTDFEMEDAEIEAEVTLDGVAYEIEIAADTGTVLEIEIDEDDADDGDEDDKHEKDDD